MPNRIAHIASAASRAAARLSVSALALVLAATPVAAAQQERPCRIVYKDAFTGKVDPTTTEASITLGPKMTQPGGGFVMMGQGKATATYGAEGQVLAGGCTVTKNRVFEYPVQAIVNSDDGANGEVDIIAGVAGYTVYLTCRDPQGGPAEYDVLPLVPPTVTLPMIRGASKTYSDSDGRARLSGTMSLEYCRIEPQ